MRRHIAVTIFVCCTVVLLAAPTPGAAQPSAPWTDWARVRNLQIGDEITVTTATVSSRDYRMAFADESRLVLVRPLGRLSAAAVDAMRRVGQDWPAVLGGREQLQGGVRIWRRGIEEAGAPVAEIEVLPREAIAEIRHTHKIDAETVLLDIASIGAFLAASGSSSYHEETKRRNQVMPGSNLFAPGLVERPVDPREIVYRTAPGKAVPLDDAAWNRLLQTLPLSLQGKGTIK